MYTQREQHKLMFSLPNVYKKSSSYFINELQLPRKAVTLIRRHLLALISSSTRNWSRTNWQSRETILVAFHSSASKAFSTFKCILRLCNLNSLWPHFQTIRAMPFKGQLPQRSQHKVKLPSRANRVYHAEVLEPFIGANLQSSWFLPIAKAKRTFHIADSLQRKELAICWVRVC